MVSMTAQKPDGTTITIVVEDKGTSFPAYDASDKPYEAYTTKFVCEALGGEFYSQIDKSLADITGDVLAYRLAEDMCVVEDTLKEHGFDPNTLRLVQ